tara:strand:- start:902 stop:1165 length:264 start_codon:yes stop_codon:yes gene_type:complete
MEYIRATQKYNNTSDVWETIQSGSNIILKTESTSKVPTNDSTIELIDGSYYNGVYYQSGNYFIADNDYDPISGWIWPSDLTWNNKII